MENKNIVHLNSQNFDEEIAQGITLVDFWASWCVPCKMLAPTIEALATEYEGKVKVAKIDTDSCSEIAVRYEIMSIPTVIIFKNGKPVDKKVGVMQKSNFETSLNKLI